MLEYCRGAKKFSRAIDLDGLRCHICCLQTRKCNEKEKTSLESEFAYFQWSRSFQLPRFVKCKRQLKQSLQELTPSEPNPRSEREKKIVIACSSPLLNVKLGILTSLLACCDGKKWTKKCWTTSVELLFSLFNLLLLRRSLCRCRCRRGIIRPFYMAGGGGLRGTPGTWGNPLRWGNLPENIISHFNFITFTW